MVTAGSGLGVAPAADEAALAASREALARTGRDHADVALVFCTGEAHERAHALLHAVRRVTGARVVVGGSGTGVLTEQRELEGGVAVAVLVVHDERLVATPFFLGEEAHPGAALAEQVGATVAEGGCLVVLPAVEGIDPRALLRELDEALGFVPVVGGLPAGAPFFALYNTDAARGVAGVALAGPAPVIGVAQGCVPIGEPYVITRADANAVYEIGSRPALEVLKSAILTLDDPEERIRRAGIFVGLAMDPAKSPLDRGDFLVRNLLGVDHATGTLAVAEHVRVGQTIQFQIRDARSSREDLASTLDDVARRLGDRRPAFGCYFDCAGRGQGLFGVPDHDVTMIRDRLGEFPLVGFFGNGELAPIGRRNFLHTYTGALVIFPA
jgi:small ligand-binding sensory domain FIST